MKVTVDGTPGFFEYDTLMGITTEYKICSVDPIESLEGRKIIKASGKTFLPCNNDSLASVGIDSYEVVVYCSAPLKILNGTFELYDQKWYVHSVSNQDTTLFVPCESSNLNQNVQFGENFIQGLACVNSFSCTFTLQGSNELKLSNCGYSFLAGTEAETHFETLFGMVMHDSASLNYTIDNNILAIQNLTNNSSIKLYAK